MLPNGTLYAAATFIAVVMLYFSSSELFFFLFENDFKGNGENTLRTESSSITISVVSYEIFFGKLFCKTLARK